MGAVESLDHCCADRSDEKTNKKYMGSWRTPPKKAQKIDLNRDYGNGAAICDDPLKDLKLDKSIDAELATVFKEVGHRFPCPIHGQEQLMKVLAGFRKRGYNFPGSDERLCARVWSMHNCSRITILQFRAWFHAEVVVSKDNLRTLLSNSRWFSSMVHRVHSELGLADDKVETVCKLVNRMRQYLEEDLISSASVQKTSRQVMEGNGKVNYLLSARGKILRDDFEALVKELLVEMYYEHFSDSLYSHDEEDDEPAEKQVSQQKHFGTWVAVAHKKSASKTYAGYLPTSESGLETLRRFSESLPVGDDIIEHKSKSLSARGTVLPSPATLQRSLKFPVGAVAA